MKLSYYGNGKFGGLPKQHSNLTDLSEASTLGLLYTRWRRVNSFFASVPV